MDESPQKLPAASVTVSSNKKILHIKEMDDITTEDNIQQIITKF